MKIIRIENCEACVPYYSCVPGVDGPYCNKQERYIYRDEIPSWCPLEDAPDTEELASNCVQCSGPNGFHYALCSKSDTGEEG